MGKSPAQSAVCRFLNVKIKDFTFLSNLAQQTTNLGDIFNPEKLRKTFLVFTLFRENAAAFI